MLAQSSGWKQGLASAMSATQHSMGAGDMYRTCLVRRPIIVSYTLIRYEIDQFCSSCHWGGVFVVEFLFEGGVGGSFDEPELEHLSRICYGCQ